MLVEGGSQHLVIQPSRDGRGGAGLEGAPACPRVCRGEPVTFFVLHVCPVQMFQIRKLESYKTPMNVLRQWILICLKIVTLMKLTNQVNLVKSVNLLKFVNLRVFK